MNQISIQVFSVNNIDRLGKMSVSKTVQIGNHVKNHRNEGFGEFNGDKGKLFSPFFM